MRIDYDDYSDIVAGLQVTFRLLGWSLATPRISRYLLAVHGWYEREYPQYAHLYPLPWDTLSKLPDQALIQLALKITGGFVEAEIRRTTEIGRTAVHSTTNVAGQISAAQGSAVVEIISSGANQ